MQQSLQLKSGFSNLLNESKDTSLLRKSNPSVNTTVQAIPFNYHTAGGNTAAVSFALNSTVNNSNVTPQT